MSFAGMAAGGIAVPAFPLPKLVGTPRSAHAKGRPEVRAGPVLELSRDRLRQQEEMRLVTVWPMSFVLRIVFVEQRLTVPVCSTER
jgi:hypothetical protein